MRVNWMRSSSSALARRRSRLERFARRGVLEKDRVAASGARVWDVGGGEPERILTEAMVETECRGRVRTLTVLNSTPAAMPIALPEGVSHL